ncbi:RluA family pseudouridine synthase [Lutibacter sp.]|uniref:RluA family pseudouridine synthase n=1 Tax=Lutibacter sp. TaxID=1925666 RepID=UPI0025B91666|nr:RluA family pseudouridine synthase [Lutibacter sp.]MCF6180855.1 RluA family pseudouridine synthase [Lutibacter sp.]
MQDYAPKIFYNYIPSNSGVKKAIKRGQILVDSNKGKTATWINGGQVLELLENTQTIPKIFECKLPVIFEDDFMAVINKPAGLTVSGNQYKTVANALPFNLSKSQQQDALQFPMPVHRIDNQTSGILLIAKTKTAQIELGKQFENSTIQKIYYTIVIGKTHSHQKIEIPIEAKTAITNFKIIKTVKSLKFKELSYLKVTPKTGRTHQIRIHLAAINHPILGDKLYGNPKLNHKGKGLFLCASEIQFLHPKTFKTIHLKIDTPHKFESMLVREKRRWNTYNLTK